MARLFGTDGIRGLANGDLTAELALDVSVAAAHVLRVGAPGRRPYTEGTAEITPGAEADACHLRCR